MGLLGLFSIVYTAVQCVIDAFEPVIPAENWENKELMEKDRARGLSEQQIMQNVKNGRYRISVPYPVPHRESDGRHRIIIENDELHRADVAQYGAYQAQKWVEQGKYNLNAEELAFVRRQIRRMYTNEIDETDAVFPGGNWDCRNTEAAGQWQRAHDANVGR